MERGFHSEKQDGVVDGVKSYGWIKVDEDVEASLESEERRRLLTSRLVRCYAQNENQIKKNENKI